jgi:small subunit ribosomal protein S20
LAHSRSALKRWRQSLNRRDRNRSVKSKTRTLLTRALSTIGGEETISEPAVRAAVSALDKAAQKGVIHANAAARSKSRLLKRFNLAQAQSVAAAAGSTSTAAEPDSKPAPRRGRAASENTPKTTRSRGPAQKPSNEKEPPRSRTRRNS